MPPLPSFSEPVDHNLQRRDTLRATAFTVLGLTAIILAKGGIQDMIAGSVGSIAAGSLAVGLTFLDGRLSYTQCMRASLPIVLMLAGTGVAIRGNALAFAGYPLLVLGLAGLLPVWIRPPKTPSVMAIRSDETIRASSSPAMSNS